RAILVHDCESLPPLRAVPRFIYKDDAGIEITLLARQPLVNGVRDDMRDPSPVLLVGEKLLADELLPRKSIPEPEFGTDPAIRLDRHPPCHKRLCIDHLPVLEARRHIGVGD